MSERATPETDPRFPSGRWVGFWTQKQVPPGKHQTELFLTFAGGKLSGEGRDWVGEYAIEGRYDLSNGRCGWIKRYAGKHEVGYEGYNEGKGIWGTWIIRGGELGMHGGFHIWPDAMPDPEVRHLYEEAEIPGELVAV